MTKKIKESIRVKYMTKVTLRFLKEKGYFGTIINIDRKFDMLRAYVEAIRCHKYDEEVFVMGLLTTVAVCVDTRGFIRLRRLGNNQLFKRDDIIPSNYLKNVLYRASFMYRRKSKLINISTEKAYELYSSDKYDNDTQGIKELAFTSLRNACKIQLKRNLVFGKKLDLSSLEFINCVKNNI